MSDHHLASLLSPLHQRPSPSYSVLQSWLQQHGAHVDSRIQIKHDDTFGWHVLAGEDIEQGTLICMIPKSLIISHRTSSLTRSIPLPDNATAADVTLHLAACLLHELRLGPESPFWPALQMLPRETVRVPSFWSMSDLCGEDGSEALRWLKGTEVEREMRRKDEEGLSFEDAQVYHQRHSTLFPPTQSALAPPNLHHFVYALSMIFTRGYVTDAYHTIALIPFCDLFNHSSTSSHTSLLSDQSVCAACGSLRVCEHDPPGTDRVGHLSPEYIARTEEEGRNVEMRAERPIAKGEQVFSCYEDGLTDSKLLVEWGYVASETDGVRWSAGDILRREDGRTYLGLWQRGRLAEWDETEYRRRRAADSSPDDTPLYLPNDPGDFGLRPDGSMSMNVVLALLLSFCPAASNEDMADSEAGIGEALVSMGSGGHFEAGSHSAHEVRGGVLRLIQERIDGLYGTSGTSERGGASQTDQQCLNSSRPLTAMAMALSLDQRRLLEEAKARWSQLPSI